MYIGPPDQQVERLSPLLREAGFEIHRAVDAVSVLDQLWSTTCGLVIANHPIAGLRLEDLLLTLRDQSSPSRHTGLVLIVGEQEYEPAKMLIGHGVNRVVARRAVPRSLLYAVGDLMDQAPRIPLRAVVEMESRLDNRPTRALARTYDLSLSGMLLLFRQPFTTGDQIRVVDQEGTVEGITIRETQVRAYAGELIVIPNRDVYKNVIDVHTHEPLHRMDFVVGIAYENDAAEACAVIEAALAPLPRVDAKPGPEALVVELGVSTVDIDVRIWCGPDQHETRVTLDRAVTAAKRALEEAGIEMPADIIALQATPSLAAALHDRGRVPPAGGVRGDD